jgi:hypothetical protein
VPYTASAISLIEPLDDGGAPVAMTPGACDGITGSGEAKAIPPAALHSGTGGGGSFLQVKCVGWRDRHKFDKRYTEYKITVRHDPLCWDGRLLLES